MKKRFNVEVLPQASWRSTMKLRTVVLVMIFLEPTMLPALALQGRGHAEEKADSKKSEDGLKTVIRDLYKGAASDKKDERTNAIRAVLPNKKDIETLFPQHAAKLWPMFDEGHKEMLRHLDQVVNELTRHGAVDKIKLTDARSKAKERTFKRLLAMIPKDVPIYDYAIEFKNGDRAGGGSYLYVNKHWVFISDAESIPEFLDRSNKK
jgi:hypothetical protein